MSSLAAHRVEYAALLGNRLFDFELVAGNLQKSVAYYADYHSQSSMALRERAICDTFLKLYPRLGGAKCYGRWGSAHVVQRRADNIDRFATLLSRPDSPVANKVVAILSLYWNSEGLTVPSYRKQPVAAYGGISPRPFAAVAPGPVTLFRLTGADSPFNRENYSSLLKGGVTTDSVQYFVLIRNASASHPLGEVAEPAAR
jgi:hypothetical protein